MDFLDKVDHYAVEGQLSPKLVPILQNVYANYKSALAKQGLSLIKDTQSVLIQLLDSVAEQSVNPYPFELFHEKIHSPVDYYALGLDFYRPLVDFKHSKVLGEDNLSQIKKQLDAKDNVIFLANHQIEPDPQIISLLLEKIQPKLAEEMIFVAGHRVITDPMAIPFSMGRNLLCIYSKKYIDHPPEEKEQKLLHNQRTMKRMTQLLEEGGKCIYVAPSGGRDRPNSEGEVEVAPFDARSIEMFLLMAKQSSHPTHFYPLALHTYHLTPPPDNVQTELVEQRTLNFAAAHLAVGKEVDMDNFPGGDVSDKKLKRQIRAEYLHDLVVKDYKKISSKS